MNYLAHLYLSGESDEMMIGNFIGDSVKGKQYRNYPADIQKGILVHRQIDSFTDSHPLVKQCSACFIPAYGRYSGIVTDVIFDHFLARYWQGWSDETLSGFARRVHTVLLSNFTRLPIEVKGFLPFLIRHRRLESYAGFEGIRETLRAMGKRTSLPDESDRAVQILREEFFLLKAGFNAFFPELVGFVERTFAIQIKRPAKQRS